MNTLAALILIVMAGGHPADARAADPHPASAAMDRAGILLAQASTPPGAGAPAPPPKIDSLPDGPPLGSLSLSQLMLKVEGEPDFAYVRDVKWRDGKYAITFVTRDGAAHERVMDPRTGRASQPAANQTGQNQTGQNQTGAGGAADTGAGNSGDAGGSRPVLNPAGSPSNAPSIPNPRASGQAR